MIFMATTTLKIAIGENERGVQIQINEASKTGEICQALMSPFAHFFLADICGRVLLNWFYVH
jgi:hypothetical protein